GAFAGGSSLSPPSGFAPLHEVHPSASLAALLATLPSRPYVLHGSAYGNGIRTHIPGPGGYGQVWYAPQIHQYLQGEQNWMPGQPVLALVADAAIGKELIIDPITGELLGRGTPPAQLWADEIQAPVIAPAGRWEQRPDPHNP